MIRIRQWHSYIGLFTAPSVLFFALTGSAQLFNLHEAHGRYMPPAVLEKLSSVHKDQVYAFGDHHPKTAEANAEPSAVPPAAAADEEEVRISTLLLKYFFLIVALSLTLSTAFGLWMGLTLTRQKRTAWSLVAAGTLIPLALLLI